MYTLRPVKNCRYILADKKGIESFINVCKKSNCLDIKEGLYVAHLSGVYIKKEFGAIADLSELKDMTVYAVIFTKLVGMPTILYDDFNGKYKYHLNSHQIEGLITISFFEAKEVLHGQKVEFDGINIL